VAEWSKAAALGAVPRGRRIEPCRLYIFYSDGIFSIGPNDRVQEAMQRPRIPQPAPLLAFRTVISRATEASTTCNHVFYWPVRTSMYGYSYGLYENKWNSRSANLLNIMYGTVTVE